MTSALLVWKIIIVSTGIRLITNFTNLIDFWFDGHSTADPGGTDRRR